MAITINYIHNKFSLFINPTFADLITKDSNLSRNEILLNINLIGLLEIDNLDFTKDYSQKLESTKQFFSDVSTIDNTIQKLVDMTTENNSESIKNRITNLTAFFGYYSFEKGMEYINSAIKFLEASINNSEWKVFYADIWQISYSLALSKDLTIAQVEELNVIGLTTLPNSTTIDNVELKLKTFKNLDERFFTELKTKIETLKKAFPLDNIRETLKFLNALDNNQVKVLWQFILIKDLYGSEEYFQEFYDKNLSNFLLEKSSISEYINSLEGFNSFLMSFTISSNIDENYVILDKILEDFVTASIEIRNNNELNSAMRVKSLDFITQLSKFISICFREKIYPINLDGDAKYFSAYDFVSYFHEFFPILFDVFDYDLSEFYELIETNNIELLKKNIQSKMKSWTRVLNSIKKMDLQNDFEIRYSKFKNIIDMKVEKIEGGDHQDTINVIFDLADSLGNIPGYKRDANFNKSNISKILSNFKAILKHIGEDSMNENIDSQIYTEISIRLTFLGYDSYTNEFDIKILTNYLNGYYNFEAVSNNSIAEDLNGFII